VTARIIQYKPRFIAFLDFLGFREIVHSTAADVTHLHWLLDGIDRVHRIFTEVSYIKTQRTTVFSDSVVISYAANEIDASTFVYHLRKAIVDLARMGLLVRGSVTFGELLHTDEYLVGPAMVRAYELESKIAKYPRVIVDSAQLQALAKHSRRWGASVREEETYLRRHLRKDSDAEFFLDYFLWDTNELSRDGYRNYLSAIAEIVSRGLRSHNPNILAKYLWMREQYIETLSHLERLARKDIRRSRNPSVFVGVEKLPKMKRAAARANRIIIGQRIEAQKLHYA
jgi:hypothetical protein